MDKGKVEEIRRILQYHRNLGIDVYPKTAGIADFLYRNRGTSPQKNVTMRGQTEKVLTADAPSMHFLSEKSVLETVASSVPDSPSLETIQEQIAQCTRCQLVDCRSALSTGGTIRGTSSTRPVHSSETFLMIVGDWLHDTGEKNHLSELVFGLEEDLMLERMLKAIQLDKVHVYVTNSIKCAVSEDVQIRAEHIESCMAYLLQEITAVKPYILCSMGSVATRILCDIQLPLSRLRGRLHRWKKENMNIPLLVTYHPHFLLKNPEMKRATWIDLQILQKKLKEIQQNQERLV